jgi:hypothetical protein
VQAHRQARHNAFTTSAAAYPHRGHPSHHLRTHTAETADLGWAASRRAGSYQARAINSETEAADAGEATACCVAATLSFGNGLARKVVLGLIVTGRSATGVEAALEFGVDGLGLGELIFKDDDSARRIEGGTTVDQFTSPRGDPQLIAGVAAVAALRALRCE